MLTRLERTDSNVQFKPKVICFVMLFDKQFVHIHDLGSFEREKSRLKNELFWEWLLEITKYLGSSDVLQ